MSLAARTKLGPYEIVAPLGAGWAKVYGVHDTHLDGAAVFVNVSPDKS